MADEIDRALILVLYAAINKALGEIEAGDLKRAKFTLAKMLPRTFERSLEKPKQSSG